MCPDEGRDARCMAACNWLGACAASRDFCPNLGPADLDRVVGNCLARCAEVDILARLACGHTLCQQTIDASRGGSPDFAADCDGE